MVPVYCLANLTIRNFVGLVIKSNMFSQLETAKNCFAPRFNACQQDFLNPTASWSSREAELPHCQIYSSSKHVQIRIKIIFVV